jgi:hypothetical protein
MHVDMVNGLSAHFVAVHDNPETILTTLFLRQPLSGKQYVTCQRLVFMAKFIERGNVFLRDDQKVHGRLRANIVKGNDLFIFIELAGRNRTGDDSAEQTVHWICSSGLSLWSLTFCALRQHKEHL